MRRPLQPARRRSADLADVDQVVGEDPAGLGDEVASAVGPVGELDVGDDAADRDRAAEDRADARLDRRACGARRRP